MPAVPLQRHTLTRKMAGTYQCPPHPYGLQPLGNAMLASEEERLVMSRGMGLLRRLPDAVLLGVFEFCSGEDLLRVSEVSRALYVFANASDLWRALVLQTWGGDFAMRASWRQSWADRRFRERRMGLADDAAHEEAHGGVDGGGAGEGEGDGMLAPDHTPLEVRGVYSDLLFKSHACATTELRGEWYERPQEVFVDASGGCVDEEGRRGVESLVADRAHRGPVGVPRVDGRTLEVATFVERFEGPSRPAILTHVATAWAAMDEMQVDRLRGRYGAAEVTAGGFQTTLRRFLEYCDAVSRSPADDQPLYMFDRKFAERMPGLSATYDPSPFFGPERDLFARLDGTAVRPDHRWLIVGPARSGSAFHKDPNATCAWNATIVGRKRWIMFPPDHAPPGVHATRDGAEVAQPVSLLEWMREVRRAALSSRAHCRPVEDVTGPGEIMFVPRGWWHMVLNLDPVVVAITQNYAPVSHVAATLAFLRTRPDQVSGVPPALAHTVHDALVRRLEPALLQAAGYDAAGAVPAPRTGARVAWSQVLEDAGRKRLARHTAGEDENCDNNTAPADPYSSPPKKPVLDRTLPAASARAPPPVVPASSSSLSFAERVRLARAAAAAAPPAASAAASSTEPS